MGLRYGMTEFQHLEGAQRTVDGGRCYVAVHIGRTLARGRPQPCYSSFGTAAFAVRECSAARAVRCASIVRAGAARSRPSRTQIEMRR